MIFLRKTFTFLLIFLGIFSFAEETQVSTKMQKKYIIGTATKGGTFYPVGLAIAKLLTEKLEPKYGLSFEAIETGGAFHNVELIEKKEVDFAILQSLTATMATKGKGPYKGNVQKNLRTVLSLWKNVEQFTVRKEFAKTGNILDLKNIYKKPFAIGVKKSGSRLSGETIMRSLGIKPDEMKMQYLGYLQSADAILEQKVYGMNTPSGPPTGVVEKLFSNIGEHIQVLQIKPEQLKDINNNYPIWSPYTIKKGTYSNQPEDIQTIAQPNMLTASKDTPNEVVFLVLETIFNNLPYLYKAHKAAEEIKVKKNIEDLPIRFHDGAKEYYKKNGINIYVPASVLYKAFSQS